MVTIELASVADAHAIAEIHVASWRAGYAGIVSAEYLAALSVEQRAASWRQQLAESSPQVIVARDGPVVAGFIATGACRDADAQASWGEIWALYVLPTHWSVGAGRSLWLAAKAAFAAQGMHTVTLWVLALNARAIRFYSSAGFSQEPGSKKLFKLGEQELAEVRLVNEHVV